MDIIVDNIYSKEELVSILKDVKGFPEYVTDNWDSIEEALASFLSDSGEDVKIINHFSEQLALEQMGSYVPILKDLQREFPTLHVEFV